MGGNNSQKKITNNDNQEKMLLMWKRFARNSELRLRRLKTALRQFLGIINTVTNRSSSTPLVPTSSSPLPSKGQGEHMPLRNQEERFSEQENECASQLHQGTTTPQLPSNIDTSLAVTHSRKLNGLMDRDFSKEEMN